MKPRTVIVMVVAIGCGLMASYLASRMLAQQKEAPPPEEKVTVLVAKQKIALGTLIKEPEKYFEPKEFTKGSEPRRAFSNFEELKDRRLNKTIGAEVHVTPDDLINQDDLGPMGEMPPGTRAVAIKVSADTSASGFVVPRSRVDICSTTRGDTGPVARIILQNMLVLAVDAQDTRDPDKKSMQSGTVLLQCKPDEAERLTLAAGSGELRLLLRPIDDHEVVRTMGAKQSDLSKPASVGVTGEEAGSVPTPVSPRLPDVPTPAVAAPQEPDALPTHTLTVINGQSSTRAVFQLSDKAGPTGTNVEKSQPESPPNPKKAAPGPEEKPTAGK